MRLEGIVYCTYEYFPKYVDCVHNEDNPHRQIVHRATHQTPLILSN